MLPMVVQRLVAHGHDQQRFFGEAQCVTVPIIGIGSRLGTDPTNRQSLTANRRSSFNASKGRTGFYRLLILYPSRKMSAGRGTKAADALRADPTLPMVLQRLVADD